MKCRVIIRFSLNGDDGSATTEIRNRLEGLGFTKIGTSSYENRHVSGLDLRYVMTAIGCITQPPYGTLDHLWVYVDSSE